MYLMKSRYKTVKPPAPEKTTDEKPSDKAVPAPTEEMPKDQTDGMFVVT